MFGVNIFGYGIGYFTRLFLDDIRINSNVDNHTEIALYMLGTVLKVLHVLTHLIVITTLWGK